MSLSFRSVLIAAFLASAAAASACLNSFEEMERLEEQANPDGVALRDSLIHVKWKARWDVMRDVLYKRVVKDPTVENLNDYAVALCHTGDPLGAIKILLRIESEHPKGYRTASNLGTAYELAGNNDLALRWIAEGIRRNPDSHEGSEWIHVAILQAKVQIAKNPKWLDDHDVLGLKFGEEEHPRMPFVLPTGVNGKSLNIHDIQNALQHQLHERLQFTSAPDAVASQLIHDFADLVYLNSKPEVAQKNTYLLYALARTYAAK